MFALIFFFAKHSPSATSSAKTAERLAVLFVLVFTKHPSGTTSSTKHFRLTGALVFVVLTQHSPSTASSTDHFRSLWDSIASKEGCSSDDSYWLLRFFGQEQSGVHRDYYSWKLIGNEDGGKGRLKEMRLIPLML